MRIRRLVLLGGPTLVLTAFVLLAVRHLAGATAADDCFPEVKPADLRELGAISGRVRVEQPDDLVFHFGDGRGTSERDTSLVFIDDPSLVLNEAVRPTEGELLAIRSPRLVDRETNNQIPSYTIHSRAVYSAAQRDVKVEVCVDLTSTRGFGPGSYEGVATLTDPRFLEADVPVRVTLKSGSWFAPLIAAILGAAAGSIYSALAPFAGSSDKLSIPEALRRRAVRLMIISMVVSVFAGFIFFQRKYVENPKFRGASADWWAVGLAAFVGSAALYPGIMFLEFIWRLMRPSDSRDRQPAEPTTTGASEAQG